MAGRFGNEGIKTDFEKLRRVAERIIENRGSAGGNGIKLGEVELKRLLHEFDVYQVELEIQNQELRRSTKALESARDEYFDLFDGAPVGFVILNKSGIVERCNQAATCMLAVNRRPVSGRLFSSYVHPDDWKDYFPYLNAMASGKKAAPPTVRIVRPDEQIKYVRLEGSGIKDSEGQVTCWRLALVDISDRKTYEDALEKAYGELEDRVQERTTELEQRSNQLARLTSELTLAEQRERKRLAELLHDHLQQLLAGAKLHLEMLSGEVPAEKFHVYQSAYDLVAESIETSRSLSAELSPPVLFQQGLAEALKWLARWMGRTHKLDVQLQTEENFPTVREEIRVLLFQSVRELLFNVVKHAHTYSAQVGLQRVGDRIQIVIRDAGTGFDPDGPEKIYDDKGFGLFTIRERLELLGGRFEIESMPESGTTVTLTAPLEPEIYKQEKRPAALEEIRPENLRPTQSTQREPDGKFRVLLVDDHAVMRNGLSSLLSMHPEIEIAGEAADGAEALEMARRIHPDVILMDINMPNMDGVEATRRIHLERPDIRIIGLSMHDADDQAAAMIEAGAEAYFNKSGSTHTLLSAIRGDDL